MELRPRRKTTTQLLNDDAEPESEDEQRLKSVKTASSKRSRRHKQDASSSQPEEPAKVTRRLRGKRGSLQYMLEVPLDILLEIFVHLRPSDLLALARTSKDFRAFLMKKRSAPYWKASRRNVEGLPPCPEDLSEPAYTNLVFESRCHQCLGGNCSTVFWSCRVRLCQQCQPKYTEGFSGDGLLINLRHRPNLSQEVKKILGQYKLSDVLGNIPYSRWRMTNWKYRAYAPCIQDLRKAIVSLKDDPPALLAHLEDIKGRMTTINQTCDALSTWYRKKRVNRAEELDALRTARQQQIIEKLNEMGWEEEIKGMMYRVRRNFKDLPEMRKPQLLTDRTWTGMKDSMIAFMEAARTNRLAELKLQARAKRVQLVAKFVAEFFPPHDASNPTVPDVVMGLPIVRETIDSLPYDVEMEEDEFDWLPGVLGEYKEQRLQTGRNYFEDLVRSELKLDDSMRDPLSLAIAAWFICDGCRASQTFPGILYHACPSRCKGPMRHRDEWQNVVYLALAQPVLRPEGYKKGIQILQKAVIAYGLDPKTATAADMDDSPVRLVCLHSGCSHPIDGHSPNDVREIMDWRVACSRSRGGHCEFKAASEAECLEVKSMEDVALDAAVRFRDETMGVGCRHCPKRVAKSTILAHVQQEHNIAEPSQADWLSLDHIPNQPPVCLVSETLRNRLKTNGIIASRFSEGTAKWIDFNALQVPVGPSS